MSIEVRKLSPAVGAEVVGLDLTASVEPDTIDALEQAFVESGVLLFREQPLSAEQPRWRTRVRSYRRLTQADSCSV